MLLCLVVKNMFIIKIKLELNKIIMKANYNYSPKAKLTNQYTRVYLTETYFNNRLSKLKNIERTGDLSAFISSKTAQDHLGLVYHLWEEGRREKGRWEEGRREKGRWEEGSRWAGRGKEGSCSMVVHKMVYGMACQCKSGNQDGVRVGSGKLCLWALIWWLLLCLTASASVNVRFSPCRPFVRCGCEWVCRGNERATSFSSSCCCCCCCRFPTLHSSRDESLIRSIQLWSDTATTMEQKRTVDNWLTNMMTNTRTVHPYMYVDR